MPTHTAPQFGAGYWGQLLVISRCAARAPENGPSRISVCLSSALRNFGCIRAVEFDFVRCPLPTPTPETQTTLIRAGSGSGRGSIRRGYSLRMSALRSFTHPN
eukprot:scaffold17682_cov113-Isochrysis_galbana.AAC.2